MKASEVVQRLTALVERHDAFLEFIVDFCRLFLGGDGA